MAITTKISNLVTVVPNGTDLVLLSQDGKTRNAKIEDVRDKSLRTEIEEARGTAESLAIRLEMMSSNSTLVGAKGDGITNDTQAFTNAINALGDGDVLTIPPGDYILDYLTIANKKNISIIGAYSADITYGQDDYKKVNLIFTTSNPQNFTVSHCPGFSMAYIKVAYKKALVDTDLWTTNQRGQGFYMEYCDDSTLLACSFNGFDINCKLYRCGLMNSVNNNFAYGRIGLYLEGMADGVYHNNFVNTNYNWNNTNNTLGYDDGAGVVAVQCGNNVWTGGKIEWNIRGMVFTMCKNFEVNDVMFDYNAYNNILVWAPDSHIYYAVSTNRSIKINNCYFEPSGFLTNDNLSTGSCIACDRVKDVEIINNTFGYGWGNADVGVPATDDAHKNPGPVRSFIYFSLCPNATVHNNNFNTVNKTPSIICDDSMVSGSRVTTVNFEGNNGYLEIQSKILNNDYYRMVESPTLHCFRLKENNLKVQINDAKPESWGTYNIGDTVESNNGIFRWRCTSNGTLKKYYSSYAFTANVDSTTTSILNVSSALSVHYLRIGEYINIAGVTGTKKVLNIVQDTASTTKVYLDSVCDVVVSNAAVSFQTPTFIQEIVKPYYLGAIPTSGYYEKGNIVYNNSPTSTGDVGWVCTQSGYNSPNTWSNMGAMVGFLYTIVENGYVYRTDAGGTKGSTKPTFPTILGASVV
jgi:hypothetical protein